MSSSLQPRNTPKPTSQTIYVARPSPLSGSDDNKRFTMYKPRIRSPLSQVSEPADDFPNCGEASTTPDLSDVACSDSSSENGTTSTDLAPTEQANAALAIPEQSMGYALLQIAQERGCEDVVTMLRNAQNFAMDMEEYEDIGRAIDLATRHPSLDFLPSLDTPTPGLPSF